MELQFSLQFSKTGTDMLSNVKMDKEATEEDQEAQSRRELSYANSCVATLIKFEEYDSLAFFVQSIVRCLLK